MRRVALLLGAAAFAAVLVVLGWAGGAEEETATLATPPPFITTTRATTTTAAPVTTTTPTTTLPAVEITPISAAEVLPAGFAPLVAISADEVWAVVGTAENAGCVIGHLNHETWAYWALTDLEARFRDLALAPDGALWAATDAGVFSFDGEEWSRRYDGPAGGIAVNETGVVWVAGNLPGGFPLPWLARGDGDYWEQLVSSEDAGQAGFTPLAVRGGEAWLAAYPGTGDLMRYAGDTLQAVVIDGYRDPPGGEGAVGVFAIEATSVGDVWVGAYLASDPFVVVLARFDGTEWMLYDWPLPGEGERTALLFDLAASADGAVWLGGETGLAFFDGVAWVPRLEGTWVRTLDAAPDGTVWYSDLDGSLYSLPAP